MVMIVYDSKGISKNIVEKDDLEKFVTHINELPKTFSGFVKVDKNFMLGSITVPMYSRGIIITLSETDGICMFVTETSKIIVAFRNGGKWVQARQL